MAEDAAAWLARRQILARTVTIKVRYDDFTTIARSHSDSFTNEPEALVRRALALLERTEAGTRPVRLLGVSVHNLSTSDTPDDDGQTPDDPQVRLPFGQEG